MASVWSLPISRASTSRGAASLRELWISSCVVVSSHEKSRQVLLSIWAIPGKIAAAGAKSLASVAAPLHLLEFLKLRPNNTCTVLFCSAALQLRRAESSGSGHEDTGRAG